MTDLPYEETQRRVEFILYGELPKVTVKPCSECPWVRTSTPGHLGPFTAREWCDMAHGETPIMCHKTLRHGEHEFDDPEIRQCAGAAQFRANVLKTPRNPTCAVAELTDTVTVFRWDDEFIEHHEGAGPCEDE